jgi:thiol-disulfide isomerase/thioredoxin
MACFMAKPIVNGIEKDLKGKARVVRLNLLSKLGREVAGSYGVTSVPSMVVFDGSGEVRYRHEGLPNRKRIVEEVTAT